MPHDILSFWFGSLDLFSLPDPTTLDRWFRGGPAFDEEIRARFGALLDEPEHVASWAQDPAGTLAAIVVLDQLSRNCFRGAARAFATDTLALGLAERAVAQEHDRAMGVVQRSFLYLPYQHAEDLARQDAGVILYTRLLDDARGGPAEALAQNYLQYAEKHRKIIVRFGRYPGRNLALGRADTADELQWLAEGGETFGQRG